jgi:hypothetical protein
MSASGSAALTEANLEARDFRLEFAHETLQSFKDKRDRSRSPRRLSDDWDAKAAALQLDIKDARIQYRQEKIQALEATNMSRDETIHNLKLDQIHKQTRIAVLEIELAGAKDVVAMKQSTIEGMQRIVCGDRSSD